MADDATNTSPAQTDAATATQPQAAPIFGTPVGATPLYVLLVQYTVGDKYQVYGVYFDLATANAVAVYGPPTGRYTMEIFGYDRTAG